MYRYAIVRLPCEDCRTDLAPRTSLYSTGGGHLCFRCHMRREIGAHAQLAFERAHGAVSAPVFAFRFALLCVMGLTMLLVLRAPG
jgi:hypothetical protein